MFKPPTIEEKMQALFNQLKGSPIRQVEFWRAMTDALLESGNDFRVMIEGMPRIEKAVYLVKQGTIFEEPRKGN